jgi:uncharacterized membrane protein YjjP (DUF1212 family)
MSHDEITVDTTTGSFSPYREKVPSENESELEGVVSPTRMRQKIYSLLDNFRRTHSSDAGDLLSDVESGTSHVYRAAEATDDEEEREDEQPLLTATAFGTDLLFYTIYFFSPFNPRPSIYIHCDAAGFLTVTLLTLIDLVTSSKEMKVETFLVKLATCYQQYGCPAHVLERALPNVGQGLGMTMSLFALPTHSFLHISRIEPLNLSLSRTVIFKANNGFNMYKLQLVDELVRSISSYATQGPPKKTAFGSVAVELEQMNGPSDKTVAVKEILKMAALGPGFFTPPANDNSLESESTNKTKPVKLDPNRAKLFIEVAVTDGAKELNHIINAKPLYSSRLQWFLTGLASSGCCGLFFKGGWIDMLVALLLGFLVGILGELNRFPHFVRLYECLAAFSCSFLARVLNHYVTPLCYNAVTISAVIFLLQGITLTLAAVDILTKNLVSGTVRLVQGFLVSAVISFSLDMGTVSVLDSTYFHVVSPFRISKTLSIL